MSAARYRWTILAVGCVAQGALGALIIAVPALSPTIQDHYDFSLGQMAFVLGAFQAGLTVSLLLWGVLADRVGERLVIGVGMSAAGVAMLVAAQTDEAAVFLAALVAGGIVSASVVAASGSAVAGWFGPRERGLAFGIRQTAAMAGQGASAAVVPVIAGAAGLGVAFAALGGLAFTAAVVSAAWMREPPAALHHAPAAHESPDSPLRDSRIWRLSAGSGLLVITQHALLGFVVLFLHNERGFSPGAAAIVLAAMSFCGAALRIVVGYWSDRLGKRLVPLRRVTMALAGALVLVTALARGPDSLLVVALVVAGTLSVAWNGLAFTAVAEIAGRRQRGAALGLQQTVLGLMGAVTPVAYAGIVTAVSWRGAFALLLVCPLLALPVLRFPTRSVTPEPIRQEAG